MDKVSMLNELIQHFTNGNKAQFAKVLEVSPQTISAWLARNTFDAELIYTKCIDVSGDWLLSGEGPMLKSTRDQAAAMSNPERKLIDLCRSLVGICEQKDSLMNQLVLAVKMLEAK